MLMHFFLCANSHKNIFDPDIRESKSKFVTVGLSNL
ncbi:MAG: hypothetical protein RLZ00_96 [Pseudomonadota bacterium]|jgi:hypothetical protein